MIGERTDGELLGLLLELGATVAGTAFQAMAESLGANGFAMQALGEAEVMFQVLSKNEVLLERIEIPEPYRRLMVELLEAVEDEERGVAVGVGV